MNRFSQDPHNKQPKCFDLLSTIPNKNFPTFEFPEEEWADISDNAKDLIGCMLRKDPE